MKTDKELLEDAFVTLNHAAIFIRSREKMNPVGVKLYDELLDELVTRLNADFQQYWLITLRYERFGGFQIKTYAIDIHPSQELLKYQKEKSAALMMAMPLTLEQFVTFK